MRKLAIGLAVATAIAGCVSNLSSDTQSRKIPAAFDENRCESSRIALENKLYRPIIKKNNSGRVVKDYEVERVRIEDWEGINYETYDPEEVAMVQSFANKPYQEIMKAKLTPREVGIYCMRVLSHKGSTYDNDNYGEDFWQSGLVTHEVKGGDCDDGAIAAASLLAPRGFPPYVLLMEGSGRYSHAVFLYKNQDGLYGAIGLNYLDVQPPKYATPMDLVKDFAKNLNEDYNQYKILNVGWNGDGFIDNFINNDPRN